MTELRPSGRVGSRRAAATARPAPGPVGRLGRILCILVLTWSAGCSGGSSAGPGSAPASGETDLSASSAETDTADVFDGSATGLAVRVSESRGYTEHFAGAGQPPQVSIYGDGTVIGYQDFTGALPDLRQDEADREEIARAVARLEEAGLLENDPGLGEPDVTDLGTTKVEIHAGGHDVDIKAYALGEEAGLNSGQRKRRAALEAFIHTARSQVGASAPRWDLPAIAVRVEPAGAGAGDSSGGGSSTPTWPFAPLSEAQDCVLLDRTQTQQITGPARRADDDTLWESGGALWALAFFPVLPDETGCGS